MNPRQSKDKWDALEKAPPAPPHDTTAQEPAELKLSGTLTQPLPYPSPGGQMVQYAAKAVAAQEVMSPVANKKIQAALRSDPDPAASLADIRRLLVGPTRNLHDAMFEEVITILEESDREVQRSLRSLEQKCASLFHITESLVFSSKDSKEQYNSQFDAFQKELQRSAVAQRDALTEMFMVIDKKLSELTAEVNGKIEAISGEAQTAMREALAKQDSKLRELEEKYRASERQEITKLQNRLDDLERKSSREKDRLSEAFTGGLSTITSRLKTMRTPKSD